MFKIHTLKQEGKKVQEEGKKKPFQSGEKGNKSKGKQKKIASVKKEGDKPVCKNCSKEGHDEAHFWKLHPELRLKKFNNKGKQKANIVIQQGLGSNSGDETKIASIVTKETSWKKQAKRKSWKAPAQKISPKMLQMKTIELVVPYHSYFQTH